METASTGTAIPRAHASSRASAVLRISRPQSRAPAGRGTVRPARAPAQREATERPGQTGACECQRAQDESRGGEPGTGHRAAAADREQREQQQRRQGDHVERDRQHERRQTLLDAPSGAAGEQVDVRQLAEPGRQQIDEQVADEDDPGQQRMPIGGPSSSRNLSARGGDSGQQEREEGANVPGSHAAGRRDELGRIDLRQQVAEEARR